MERLSRFNNFVFNNIEKDENDNASKAKSAVQMLLTELDEELYGEGSWIYSDGDDDDDVEIKKEPGTLVTYENNIEDDKDYETDLEGLLTSIRSDLIC